MTQEQINELLKPRYKVTNIWPDMGDSKYFEGEIIQLTGQDEDCSQWWTKRGLGKKMYDAFFDNYPHLFKRLQWWQERSPEELPRYVRNAADGIIFIVEYNFNSPTPSDARTWNKQFRIPFWHSLYDLLPATEADYNEYLQTLTHNQEP